MTQPQFIIALASDHAGFLYKEKIKDYLRGKGIQVRDFGTDSEEPVDYPLVIRPAAEAVARGECTVGIILGGSGNGEAMVANKVRNIRCAVCWNEATARYAKEHNDANIISLGQRVISLETAFLVIDTWLAATFQGGRHARRIKQLES